MSNIVVLYDATFPFDGQRPDPAAVQELRRRFAVTEAAELAAALPAAECLILLHGSYFPKAAWPAIMSHVQAGKGLICAGGGMPFRSPVDRREGEWIVEREQTAYHQQLTIHEGLETASGRSVRLASNEDWPLLAGRESLFAADAQTLGFILHTTRSEDSPGQPGSSGPMNAHLHPLLYAESADGRRTAAPVVLLEHTKGEFAGGRWIFANQALGGSFWHGGGGVQALGDWADFCKAGVTELWLKPNYASYEPGEQPVLTLQLQALARSGFELGQQQWDFRLTIAREKEGAAVPVWETAFTLQASTELILHRLIVPAAVEPGFYRIVCRASSSSGEQRVLRQGIWGFDGQLLSEGDPLQADRDYFRKDGRPLPIVGMTYMASDVARKFLFLPNAAVWDRDMAQMKQAGINLIRTGVWTAWRQLMFVDGHPSEEAMRAIDAFLLTAARHRLEVTFTFFSFTPEMWEGINPYLDPRSVEAQKRFIAAIVSRHASSSHVQWDLINEPTMFDPARAFHGPRTLGDRFEQAAFADWLASRHQSVGLLQERWNMTPLELPAFSAVKLPQPEHISFSYTDNGSAKKSLVWLDYCLFTMEMHNKWIKELTATIRFYSKQQLVTVGQDEGMCSQRPSPFFYAEAVDYTTVHSWWLMDFLLWDGLFTKTPDKPNLAQETGIMYVEGANGRAKRSEEELRNILERKYAYAFASGGAGAVQWIWNTNAYMNSVNESNIGALRADGTEKLEADVSYDFGRFMDGIRDLFEDRREDDVVVVFPFSNDFSNRSMALDATTKLTRVLSYEMKVPFRAVGEYHLEQLADSLPALIIVPSAHNFSDAAFGTLTSHIAEHGGTLLFTGPMGIDEYWQHRDRFTAGSSDRLLNVLREETMEVCGIAMPVTFGGGRIAEVFAEGAKPRNSAYALRTLRYGSGTVIHCPLPIELNERAEPIRAVYAAAMELAGIQPHLIWRSGGEQPGIYGRKLPFRDGALFVFVSESGDDTTIEVADPAASGTVYSFLLERERTVMFAVDGSGAVTAVYRPDEVVIAVTAASAVTVGQ